MLDEADRILDMGFQRTLSALLSHLPKARQTLLFSATQTDSVSDLARLSLKDPVYIGVHDSDNASAMPKSLEQHYVLCTLDQKLDLLWSFLKSHLQSKVLVFLSSCKQVRFVFETFRRLHPGVPLLHLHGKQKQMTRLATFQRFTGMKHAVLFATDIAARGLDFPAVNWVLQVDAPEDAETYIHRVGRTARYESAGKGLLFLMPSEEEGMTQALAKKSITAEKIKIRASKTQSIENQLQNLAFQDPEIKYLAQRVRTIHSGLGTLTYTMCYTQAFVSYLRSVHLQKDKSIFKVAELPAERFAEALGLPGMPKIKFLTKEMAKKRKNASYAAVTPEASLAHRPQERSSPDSDDSDDESSAAEQSSDDEGDPAGTAAELEASGNKTKVEFIAPTICHVTESRVFCGQGDRVRTKYDRMFERKNQDILSAHYNKLVDHSADRADSDDDFITLKRADHELSGDDALPASDFISKRKQKMALSKKALAKSAPRGEKLVFDDEGNPHKVYEMKTAEEVFKGAEDVKEAGRKFAEGERGKLKQADVADKAEAKEKKREKKRKRKEREREVSACQVGQV